jgi:hypothetical protein
MLKRHSRLEQAKTADRDAERLKAFIPTYMEGGGVRSRAHILNISASGAMMHCTDIPEIGSLVRILWKGKLRAARVQWQAANRFGVRFQVPLPHDELEAVVRDRPSMDIQR